MTGIPALVLAGSRGPDDPMARAAGVRHKAFIDVAGEPMLARVLRALRQTPGVGEIFVVIEAPELLAGLPVTPLPAAGSPALSVADALARIDAPAVLVTTADHALATAAMFRHFLDHVPAGADVTAAVATREVILAGYPGSRRTWLAFRDRSVSGCNMFLLRPPRAGDVARFWRRMEEHRKRPWRMAAMLGFANLIGFALKRFTLDQMLRRLGRQVGATLAVVEMPMAEAAIDVDKPEDLDLVRRILALAGAEPAPP